MRRGGTIGIEWWGGRAESRGEREWQTDGWGREVAMRGGEGEGREVPGQGILDGGEGRGREWVREEPGVEREEPSNYGGERARM